MAQWEKEIIARIRSGELNAYKVIVDKYADEIMGLCYRYLNSREEAEDATQDVFIKAYLALDSWEPRARFKTWLYRIAINHSLNILRRRKKIAFQTLESFDEKVRSIFRSEPRSNHPDAESQIISDQMQEFIKSAIGKLPENQRQVIILYYYQKLSYKDIADVLGTSVSSVESRLFRAKKSLAKILKK